MEQMRPRPGEPPRKLEVLHQALISAFPDGNELDEFITLQLTEHDSGVKASLPDNALALKHRILKMIERASAWGYLEHLALLAHG